MHGVCCAQQRGPSDRSAEPSCPALPRPTLVQDKYPPRDFPLPPQGCRNQAVIELVKRVNEAAQALPDWEAHPLPRGNAAVQV